MSTRYTVPPDKFDFYIKVWEIVRQIPPGSIATYGQVAGLVSPPDGVSLRRYRAFGPRWVGGAMAACPEDVPWQRVVNAQGKVSYHSSDGDVTQQQLLENEGVVFDERGRIDLKRYGWPGPKSD